MLPSLNQAGFDYVDWIVGAVEVGEPDESGAARAILWATGASRDAEGRPVADPHSDFLLPLAGTLRGDAFVLGSEGFTMRVTGIPIPCNVFQIRGAFGPGLVVRPGASLYAETQVLSIPTFGPLMVMAGLANDLWRKLVVSGTYVTRPYVGPANRRPAGVAVESLVYIAPASGRDGRLTAVFALGPKRRYPAAGHRPAILLLDAERREPVALDYADLVSAVADPAGNLAQVRSRPGPSCRPTSRPSCSSTSSLCTGLSWRRVPEAPCPSCSGSCSDWWSSPWWRGRARSCGPRPSRPG
jgi:hypothetical protein